MTGKSFTTRAEAAATGGLDPAMVEAMAEGAYEAMKPTGSSLPPWPRVEPTYQAAVRREVTAAIRYGLDAGYLTLAAKP